MTFHRYGNLILDVERVFGVEIVAADPLRIKVLLVGSRPEEFTGEAARQLLEDATTWLD